MSTQENLKRARENLLKISEEILPVPKKTRRVNQNIKIVAIGVSTGGPNALRVVLSNLPDDIPCPILVVQHMPPKFTKSLAQDLNKHSLLDVCEAYDGQSIIPGSVYIAPGGRHMKIETIKRRAIIRITDDAPINNCKPSVDHLYKSVASEFGENSLAVILTGMGNDGNLGAKLIAKAGGKIIVQNEETCVVFGMPKEPLESGTAQAAYPIQDIARQILKRIVKRSAA